MLKYDRFTQWFFDKKHSIVEWQNGLKSSVGFTDEEILNLAGAPAQSTVTVEKIDLPAEQPDKVITILRLTVRNDILLVEPTVRDIILTEKGMTLTSTLYNKIFHLRAEFRGLKLGARSCAIEIMQAKALDFSQVDVWAIGNPEHSQDRKSDSAMSGFAVWPRLGFDGTIPQSVRSKIPASWDLEKYKLISSLMATPQGIAFWDANGDECKLSFDLARKICWDTLGSYLEANNIEVKL